MNAGGVSTTEIGAYESDSDKNSDDSPGYHQPISSEDAGDDQVEYVSDHYQISGYDYQLPNGVAENGVSSLDWSDEDGEEEMAESERATEVAFQENEQRRNAPLPPENSVRIIEAMRGISFAGTVPEWADQVPEDQWLNRLRTLRPSAAGR